MMGNLGVTELLIIFLVILLVFGAKRIPEIARGMGKGIREFKDATNDIKRELTVADAPPPRPQIEPPTYVRSDAHAYAQPGQPAGAPAPQPGYGPPPVAQPSAPEVRDAGAPPVAPPPTDGQHTQS